MSSYENIPTPEQCVDLAFEEVLPKTNMSKKQHKNLVQVLKTAANGWGSKFFLKGSEEGIYNATLTSLKDLQISPYGYSRLAIRLERGEFERGEVVSLNYFHNTGVHVFKIWCCRKKYFMISYEKDMDFSEESMKENGITREYIPYYDKQVDLLDTLRSKGVKLNCSSCKNHWDIDSCSNVTVVEEKGKKYVFFYCPACRIGELCGV